MGSIGAPELIVIALIALILFGGSRIADIGKGLGQGIKQFKAGLKDGAGESEASDSKSAKASQPAKAASTTGTGTGTGNSEES